MTRPRRQPARGLFISFEGGEGAGKSTQIALLRARLEAIGRVALATREPGGSENAEKIRSILLSGKAKHLGDPGEAILFAAARRDHVRSLILPALARGDVLCDRFVDSTRVYQGIMGQLDETLLDRLAEAATGGLLPDLTIVIDVPVAVGLERARMRRCGDAADRFEAEAEDFHERVRRAFLSVAEADPGRCVVVDGAGDADAVAADIWAACAGRLRIAGGEGA